MSGKTDLPGCGKLVCGFFYYSVIVLLRLTTLALMAVCLGPWFPVYLAASVVTNGMLAFATLKPSFSKTLWTSFTSVAAPSCYISKYKVPTLANAGEAFHRHKQSFFCSNAVIDNSIHFTQVLPVELDRLFWVVDERCLGGQHPSCDGERHFSDDHRGLGTLSQCRRLLDLRRLHPPPHDVSRRRLCRLPSGPRRLEPEHRLSVNERKGQ